MLAYVTCPYDGHHYSKDDQIETVSARRVAALLASYAETDHGRDPDLENRADDSLAGLPTSGSVIDGYALETKTQLVPQQLGRGGPDEPWYRLPCPNGPHFVPVSFADAFERGNASVVALVGPTGSGKTHVLSAIARRVCADRLLAPAPLSLDISTYEVGPHWDQFRELYVDPLFSKQRELKRSSGNALHYTSLFMVCKSEAAIASGDPTRRSRSARPDEWLVVTDSWGESARPRNITEDGWYLGMADTIVICIDGADVVASLDRELARPDGESAENLVSYGDWAAHGSDLALPAGLAPDLTDDDEDAYATGSRDEPLHYCEVATDYLVDPAVVQFRLALRRAARPNIMVAITKADLVETALYAAQSSLAERFTAVLTDKPEDELNPEFLWERNKLVAVLLMATGFEPFVIKLLRRFPHPIFTALTATGASPSLSAQFDRVTPRGVEGPIVNHLIARRWFNDEKRLRGMFGPDGIEPT